MVKTRTTNHERTIREFTLGRAGLTLGAVLRDFDGVLNGAPVYRGTGADLLRALPVEPNLPPEDG